VVAFCLYGCGNLFSQKPTEMESKRILTNLAEIHPVAEPNTPIPQIYTIPPEIIQQTIDGKEETKLFYFCRNLIAKDLEALVNKQFAVIMQKDKQTIDSPNYTVTCNPAVNQLIVRCPSAQEAQHVLDFLVLVDVQPIQVKIDCLVSEVYADLTMDWETTLKIENLFGETIYLGGKTTGGDLLPAFPGAALRETARASFGLKTGYIRNEGVPGREFRALVDLLVSRGYLKIMMNPSVEVVNGKTARFHASEHVPLQKEFLYQRDGFVSEKTEYIDVEDILEVTPHVFADGTIGLETSATIGSKSTPEGVKQIRIITKRSIEIDENRIRPGESLVVGGIRKIERSSVVRGVPFLKDIPLLGVLFSSKDYEDRAKEVIFILTPTISSGGIPNYEMVDMLQKKHDLPISSDPLYKAVSDPWGLEASEEKYLRGTLETEHAQAEARNEKQRASLAVEKAERALAEAQKAKEETQHAKLEAAHAEKQTQTEKQKAAEAIAQAEKAQQETQKAKKQIQQANQKATDAEQQAQAEKQKAAEAIAQAEKAQQETQKAKEQIQQANQKAADAEQQAQAEKQKAAEAIAQAEEAQQEAQEAKAEAQKAADAEKQAQAEKQKAAEAAAQAEEAQQKTQEAEAQKAKQQAKKTETGTLKSKIQSDKKKPDNFKGQPAAEHVQ